MAITEKIVFSIKEQCTGKIPNDDTRLIDDFILHQMNVVRAILIREDIVSKGSLDSSYYQMKCCIEVLCDNISCGGIDSGQVMYYANLPKLIEGVGWKDILYFGTAEFPKRNEGLHKNFDRYNFKGFLAMEYQEWINRRPSYTIVGGYQDGDTSIKGTVAMIKNLPTRGMKNLCVLGLWADVEDGFCETEDFMASEYPLPETLVHRLELIVVKHILSTEPVPGDSVQDAKDNTGNQAGTVDPRIVNNMSNQKDYKDE
jgi:hypothetical protein